MPMIRVEMYEGRTVQQKRALAEKVTEAFISTCGGPPEAVQVLIADVAKQDWATAGVLAADKT
jgi:4-oxalocrotonate tautomerase